MGAEWTDSGERHEETSLKHREDHESRPVPCCPELTAILHEHLRVVGTATDGRLFWGERSQGRLGSSVYGRVWATARRAVFTPEVYESPLAKRPYDFGTRACRAGSRLVSSQPGSPHGQGTASRCCSGCTRSSSTVVLRSLSDGSRSGSAPTPTEPELSGHAPQDWSCHDLGER